MIKEKKLKNNRVIAIVLAKDWYWHYKKLHYPVLPDDYVVCQWLDFHDGVKSNIEGRETIAICRNKVDAELIFNSNYI